MNHDERPTDSLPPDGIQPAADRDPGDPGVTGRPVLRTVQGRRDLRPLLIALTVLAISSGIGYAMMDSTDAEYYQHVDEVQRDPGRWRDKRLQIHGFVAPGSIARRFDRDRSQLEYKFRAENCGASIDVRFAGVVPDTFKDGAEVVIKGRLRGAEFQGQEIMAKCPSKYAQGGEQQSAMVTRCSREKDKDKP